MARQLELYSLSSLEKNRIRERKSDLTDLSRFNELESVIRQSLNPESKTSSSQIKATPQNPLLARKSSRPFQDSAMLERLLQIRNQIPISSRIIRTQDS
jgi:hypothetical protein